MLRRKGIRVVSITEHADDSPTGKLMEAIIESVDEFYSENLVPAAARGPHRNRAGHASWLLAAGGGLATFTLLSFLTFLVVRRRRGRHAAVA